MKLGILREGKTPPDSRVALTPEQCVILKNTYNIEVVVQASPDRCIKDEEYATAGINIEENLSNCDIILGVKEVPKHGLIPEKVYFFFSHTIKKQSYNRELLQSVIKRRSI